MSNPLRWLAAKIASRMDIVEIDAFDRTMRHNWFNTVSAVHTVSGDRYRLLKKPPKKFQLFTSGSSEAIFDFIIPADFVHSRTGIYLSGALNQGPERTADLQTIEVRTLFGKTKKYAIDRMIPRNGACDNIMSHKLKVRAANIAP